MSNRIMHVNYVYHNYVYSNSVNYIVLMLHTCWLIQTPSRDGVYINTGRTLTNFSFLFRL